MGVGISLLSHGRFVPGRRRLVLAMALTKTPNILGKVKRKDTEGKR